MKSLFIMNPISGSIKKSGFAKLIDEHIDKDKFEYKIRYTERAGHATEIAREACKQSGRCIIPDVSGILSVKNIILDPQLPGVNIVPWENADSCGPLAFSNSHPDLSSVGILIGPEGGIDQAEIDFLCNSGFIPVTVGKRILRTETAGLAAISAIMCLYGEMD